MKNPPPDLRLSFTLSGTGGIFNSGDHPGGRRLSLNRNAALIYQEAV
jgi:hypothetical protein